MPSPFDKKTGWHTPPDLWEKLKPLAREHRHDPTPAEKLLWKALRSQTVLSWRRQHPIGPFMVDFYCAAARLVIEVDGSIHVGQEEADAIRQEFIEAHGLRVIRFTNDEVIGDVGAVLDRIAAVIETPTPAPSPACREEE